MRVGRQSDQRRPPLLVSLRRLDHSHLGPAGRVHHRADVAEPLRSRRVELAADEVAHVDAGRGLALSAVAEIEAAARERHAAAGPPLLRKDKGCPLSSFDHDRRRRSPVPRDPLDREGLELGLGVAGQLLVDQLLVDPGRAGQDDDSAAGVRHRRDVPDELDGLEPLPDRDALRASRGLRGAAQEPVHMRVLARGPHLLCRKAANEPATAATIVIAHSSRKMSTIRPPVVTGFLSCEDTVRSCVVTQKNPSKTDEMFEPFLPCSSMYIKVVPTASTASVSTSAVASRLRSFECSWVSPTAILRTSTPKSWSKRAGNTKGTIASSP